MACKLARTELLTSTTTLKPKLQQGAGCPQFERELTQVYCECTGGVAWAQRQDERPAKASSLASGRLM